LEPVHPIVVPEDLLPQLTDDTLFDLSDGKTIDLSVEQAILLSLQNNQDLRVRQIKPVIAGTFEKIERGVYDAEFFAELEFTEEKNSETDQTGDRTAVEENDHTAVVGLRQKLPFGTTVEASVEQYRSDSSSDVRNQNARMGLSVTQSLLRGFGPAALNTTATIHELRGVTEALLADTETAYWDYVLARQKIDIFERSLTIAMQQLDEIRQRIEVGILPKIEKAAAHAEVARREQALIDARSKLEENRLLLLRLINPGGDGQMDFQINAISETLIDPEPVTDLDDRLQLARKSRPDLNEARLRLQQNRLEIIITRNGILPKLDLFISLGKTGYGESFSDSFRNMDENTHDFTVGIRMSHFLGNRQADARNLAARASWQQSSEAVKNLEQIVVLDVRLAVNEVERIRQQIAATRVTRILQEETLHAEKERFDVGASTALLVAQAQRDLLASSISEVEAVVNYRQALVALYLIESSLLERRGIRLS
ncbi:MAG: TolC family protein, partial [Deltaproteobacteria bacterium]|nr:TolC family protein [Deltaproteobacteria bacterium]